MLDLFEGDRGPRETFRFIEDKLGVGTWRWDVSSGNMEWSRGFFALLGIDPGAAKPSIAVLQQLVHPDDRFFGQELSEFLQGGTPLDWDCRILKPNGRVRWLSSRIEALFDAKGQITRAIGVSLDVTKQREHLQKNKNTAARFDALLASVEGLVCVVDSAGNVIRSLKGSDHPKDLSTQGPVYWLDLVHPDDRAGITQRVSETRLHLRTASFEHRFLQADGTVGWRKTVIIPVLEDQRLLQEWIHISVETSFERRYLPLEGAGTIQLTGPQIRAARGILMMSVKELADAAKISPSAIRRYEEVKGPNAPEAGLKKLHTALVAAGIEFIFPRSGEPSARPLSSQR
jgi:PAS domain-containing protein